MGEYRKTFVNRIYTVGLTTCGSALVRIAGATESEGFQKVASFVNKWICGGNNTGQTLAEIQALCNEILNEVKIVDQHLKEYDAEIENTLQKIQYTEAKNELNQQWSKDIDVYETAGNVGNTLSAYEDYMKAAQLYMDGKTDINAVEKSKQKLYDNFIEVYKAAGNSFENPTDEKKKDAIFCNDTIDGVFKRSIWSMINALNKPSDEKNYADAAAQFAYRAYGFSGDQYNYIVSSIDKQFMEIIKMEMMYQEFIAQRGDYFEEKYPDDESKWESYAASDGIVGGIAVVNSGTIENCMSIGTLSTKENGIAGGIVGKLDKNGSIQIAYSAQTAIEGGTTGAVFGAKEETAGAVNNTYYQDTLSGNEEQGTAKTAAEMKSNAFKEELNTLVAGNEVQYIAS